MSKVDNGQRFSVAICMKFIERFGAQFVTIFLHIILARLLVPEDYGTLAILNVFVVLAQVITQHGLNNAVVQKQDIKDEDYSTALILSMAFALVLYFVLFLLAPVIATFYNNPDITVLLRVLSLSLFAVSINSILMAVLMKKMQFKKIMIVGISSNLVSCVSGVAFAYFGFGVWALILQQLISVYLHMILVYFCVRWKYPMRFSWKSAKFIIKYGGTLSVASIIDNLYYDAESLIIGKSFSQALLGIYNNSRTYPLRVISSVKDTIAGVVFPAMSKVAKKPEELKNLAKTSISLFSFIVFPAMIGFSLIAEEFTLTFLSDKWSMIITPMRMFCFSFSLLSISSPNVQIFKALGKARLYLNIELVRKGLALTTLIVVSLTFKSINAVAVGSFISTAVTAFAISAIAGHQIKYELPEQLKDLFKTFVPVVTMCLAVLGINSLLPSGWFGLRSMIIKILIGAVSYLGVALIVKHPIIIKMLNKLKSRKGVTSDEQ